jgi:hypothetical protein
MKEVTKVIKELELGYIPNELLFLAPEEKHEEVQIDWTALHYNDWDDFDFWCSTHMPEGLLEQWPCLEEWAREEYESREKKTPLQEIEERQKSI